MIHLDLAVTNNRQYLEIIITEMTTKLEAWTIPFIQQIFIQQLFL